MKYLFLLSMFFSSIAAAVDHSDYPYRIKPVTDCEILPELAGSGYVGVYKGGCSDGLADGQGEVRFYGNNTHVDKPYKVLKGLFRSGLYMGDVNYKNELLIDGRELKTKLGVVDGNEVWLHTRIHAQKEIVFCPVIDPLPTIIVSIKDRADYIEEEKTKSLLKRVYEEHQQYCKHDNNGADLHITVHDEFDEVLFYEYDYPVPPIRARLNNAKDGLIAIYENTLAYKLSSKNATQSKVEKKKAARKKAIAKLEKHGVKSVLTTTRLAKNPFKFEGQVIGIISQLELMLSKDTAYIKDASSAYSPFTHVKNVKGSYFKGNKVLLIGKVTGLEKIDGDSVPSIDYVDHYQCNTKNCDELSGIALYKYTKE